MSAALSHLQRHSGKTLRDLAEEARVSPSYICRVLSSERCPSWKVTRRIVTACRGDLDAVRLLWDTARGQYPVQASSLHTALRGLHLSAACPAPAQIRRSTNNRITEQDVTALLYGAYVPEWETVAHLVDALHGRLETIHPLWAVAHISLQANSRLLPIQRTLPAECFG
ncbi:helix-turn-helix transcriptional regulator [Streptomyces sp. NPDC050610]|uniref:helix-turn-helix domain-containing protein n=1 Tax=Streptomyces sp. NPDC050610 TaxID=3157097 RepID=UPI00341F1832